jgi:hypothetical protein
MSNEKQEIQGQENVIIPAAKNTRQKNYTSKSGNEYVFQKVLPSVWLEAMDDVVENGQPKRALLYPMILQNVVVVPGGLKVDDFETNGRNGYPELEEVAKAALSFQQGK